MKYKIYLKASINSRFPWGYRCDTLDVSGCLVKLSGNIEYMSSSVTSNGELAQEISTINATELYFNPRDINKIELS